MTTPSSRSDYRGASATASRLRARAVLPAASPLGLSSISSSKGEAISSPHGSPRFSPPWRGWPLAAARSSNHVIGAVASLTCWHARAPPRPPVPPPPRSPSNRKTRAGCAQAQDRDPRRRTRPRQPRLRRRSPAPRATRCTPSAGTSGCHLCARTAGVGGGGSAAAATRCHRHTYERSRLPRRCAVPPPPRAARHKTAADARQRTLHCQPLERQHPGPCDRLYDIAACRQRVVRTPPERRGVGGGIGGGCVGGTHLPRSRTPACDRRASATRGRTQGARDTRRRPRQSRRAAPAYDYTTAPAARVAEARTNTTDAAAARVCAAETATSAPGHTDHITPPPVITATLAAPASRVAALSRETPIDRTPA